MKANLRFMIPAFVEKACRIGFGALFAYSSLSKVEDPGVFADAVMRYEMLPEFAVGMFALTLPMVELLSGLAIVFTKWTREAAFIVTGMLLMFLVALTIAVVRGLDIDCGCFGSGGEGDRAELLTAIARDLAILPFAVWLMFRRNSFIWQIREPDAPPDPARNA